MKILIIVITFIWVGLILGLSFVEAPLKFTAPNITLELGLGIGKIVFGALNKIEIILSLGLIACFLIGKLSLKHNYLYGITFLILLVQSIWLIPLLNKRVDMITNGQTVRDTYHHHIFVILEVTKTIILSIAGIKFFKKQIG